MKDGLSSSDPRAIERSVVQAGQSLEEVSRVRHLSLFERAPAAYVRGANFLS